MTVLVRLIDWAISLFLESLFRKVILHVVVDVGVHLLRSFVLFAVFAVLCIREGGNRLVSGR